jgi:hypothetical protein
MTQILFCASALAKRCVVGACYINSVISAGIKAREIRPRIDAKKLATLIISSLESAVMVYRLERNEEALRAVQSHLNSYLETEVRVPSK